MGGRMNSTTGKSDRLLQIYSRLVNGEIPVEKGDGGPVPYHRAKHPARRGSPAVLLPGTGPQSGRDP